MIGVGIAVSPCYIINQPEDVPPPIEKYWIDSDGDQMIDSDGNNLVFGD